MALWIRPAPQQNEHKAPSHRSNLWPPRERRVIRAQATNSQENSRSSNKDGWKTETRFIKQSCWIYFCLWRRERDIWAVWCTWYISGTFGHPGFVSFGDSTLNSRRPGTWDASVSWGARGQIKYTAGRSWIFKQHIRVNDVTASLHHCFFWRWSRSVCVERWQAAFGAHKQSGPVETLVSTAFTLNGLCNWNGTGGHDFLYGRLMYYD